MFPMANTGFFKRGGSSCPSYTPGLYTAEEIDTLVNVDGYIPVASAAEFDLIDSGVSETMGVGTCWEGTYTTGTDKLYVQIENINLTSLSATYVALAPTASFVYDGNNKTLSNLSTTGSTAAVHLFSSPDAYTFKNSIIDTFTIDKTTGANGGILGQSEGSYTNIEVRNSTISGSSAAGLTGAASSSATVSGIKINNCTINATGSAHGVAVGCNVSNSIVIDSEINGTSLTAGICNLLATGCTVESTVINSTSGDVVCGVTNYAGAGTTENNVVLNSTINANGRIICGISQARSGHILKRNRIQGTNVNVTGSRNRIGGISGLFFAGGTIEECEVINCNIDAPSSSDVGGIVGYDQSNNTNLISDCRVVGGTVNGGSNVGGIMGRAIQSNTTNTNSFSTAAITGSSNVGGAYGGYSSATITAVYWDTVTSSNPTSAAGTGQTTSALQTPTTNSGIYSAWSLAVWDFGLSTEYPTLINTP
jgi:hypothetical protein